MVFFGICFALITLALIRREVKGVVWGEVGNLVGLGISLRGSIHGIRKGYRIDPKNNVETN
jgi:hypothetical protein